MTKIVIPSSDITKVLKAKIALFIPNSIKLYTLYNEYFFASFLNREKAFRLMEKVRKGERVDPNDVHAEYEEDEEEEQTEAEASPETPEEKERGEEIDWEEILLDGFDTAGGRREEAPR